VLPRAEPEPTSSWRGLELRAVPSLCSRWSSSVLLSHVPSTRSAPLLLVLAQEEQVKEGQECCERRTLEARKLFVFIGAEPYTHWLGAHLALDDRGFILTGRDAARVAGDGAKRGAGHEPFLLETTWPGVFAAGDLRSGSIKRVASAVGEGASAAQTSPVASLSR
jgi:thioredoxin reductase